MLSSLVTPAALIDERRMSRNIARMQERMNSLGVRFRPHVKTSKCIEVVRRQVAAGARGITVSTLKEAEEFFAAGIADILYAVCIPPHKLAQALSLRRRGCRLCLLVDSVEAAEALVQTGCDDGERFEVMIEVDSDGHRSGVAPEGELLLQIGAVLHAGGALLKGVMTHAGSSYEQSTPAGLERIAEEERSSCVRAAERLRAAGLPCPVVSVGSTPTALSAAHLDGVTEVRAGVYVFFDLVMANIGVCTLDDVALSVLTTVIGHQADKGRVIVDAGWMALSRDRGTATQRIDYGYGALCDLEGHVVDGYRVAAANQEHGIVERNDGGIDPSMPARFPIGSQWRLLPNHACATATQFSRYGVLGGGRDVATWERFHGW